MAFRKNGLLSFMVTVSVIMIASAVAFGQPAQPQTKDYEGVVKAAVGHYLYIPQAQGLDIFVAGTIQGGLENLVGKEVRVKASPIADKPNLILAESIEIKEGTMYTSVYTRSAEPDYAGYISPGVREGYVALNVTNINKPEEWEGKAKVKVYGKLQTSKVKEGGQEKEVTHIVLTDRKGKEIGRIIVNGMSEYANFYLKKLRLFDRFWFYLDVTGQVDKRVRARTRELFSGNVVFCGLY
ncbi:MAG: hypothetical protein QHH43_02360 [Candidatus Saccharicenans sp.]|jgi:hypothetical protein|nr:hypothetical protein [Candidatus Saccharicenans sp.]MDH7574588.1 hypothetical protein [Candidatus Saccharicenans sp.]